MERVKNNLYKNLLSYLLLGIITFSYSLWTDYKVENSEKGTGYLKFSVLDIGQGDALYIESPTGKQVLVDGGPNKNLMKQITKVISPYDRRIDVLVVTNPDRDHYEGFIPLLDKYSVDLLLEPGTTNKYPAYKVFRDKIEKLGVKRMLARKGQIIELGGGAYLEVLFPDRDVSEMSPNDGSIVMKLVYGETSVMLQGDSTSRMEQYLRGSVSSTTLKSNILKAGHHGSRTSSSIGYVKAISPDLVVVSSGRNNDYGHPHKEVITTMKELDIPMYDTCNNGQLDFQSDGKTFTFLNKNPKEVEQGCKTN